MLVIVKKWKGYHAVFKCLEMAKPSESVSVHLHFFSIKGLQHNSSFVMRAHVKASKAAGPGAAGSVRPQSGNPLLGSSFS